jgi:hypothetical protein
MRKPSISLRSRIVQGALVLLVISACDRADQAQSATSTVTGGVAGNFGSGTALRERATGALSAVMSDEAKQLGAPAMEPASAPAPSMAGTARSSRGDASLGVPLPTIDPTGAMLVRNGRASVEVKAVDDALARVRQAASQFGGFVANTAVQSGKDEQRSAMLQIRVPSAQFDGLVASLSQLGKVESVSVSAEDVAEEYVDLGARAANARRVEARLVELLATRTGKLSDVLTVEQELARVRQETERYDARMRWLERRATLSSLDVSIHERLPLIDSPRGRGPIAEALAEAWTRLVGVLAWCIASLGVLIPVGVIIGVGVAVARRVWRGGTTGKGGEATA